MPGIASCPGGLIVIGIISLSFVHINSEICSNEVPDVQYGRLGSSVTLACGGATRGAPLEWRLNGSAVLPRPAPTADCSLTLPRADGTMEGNYSCHDQRGTLIQAIKLRLGYAPGYLNISCRVPSHHRIYCSWTPLVETFLPTSYNAFYLSRSHGEHTVERCIQQSPNVNTCVITNQFMWFPHHYLNVSVQNPLGSNWSSIKIDLQQLFKPDPPEEVTVVEVVGHPTKLLVEWKAPRSWLQGDAFPLGYQLQYKPVGSKYWSELYVEAQTSVMIMDALAGHVHHVQVRARDGLNRDSQWSEWSSFFQALPWTDYVLHTEEATDVPEIFETTETVDADAVPSAKGSVAVESASLGLLVGLSLFAAVILLAVFTVIGLLWVRQRKRNSMTKQELNSTMKMKSMLI